MIRPLPALCILLSLLALPRAAPGYSILSTNGYDSFRWPAGAPIPWTYDPAGSDDLPVSVIRTALTAAFGSWEDVDGATIAFTQQGPSFAAEDGRIHIVFEEETWDATTADAAAVAETFRNGRDEIVRATIRFNGADMRWLMGDDPLDPFAVDFQGVATHEIGHTVGLAHSRERHAAMFFAGGDSGGRTLDADDERGLRYLYPTAAFHAGVPCDSCATHEHCAEGACLFFLEEGGYCGADCDDEEDCPAGFVCQEVAGAGPQCLPRYAHCDERGSNIPTGSSCYGDATCASGACLATPDSAFCTESCDPTVAGACGDEAVCVATGSTGLCISPGPVAFGLPCRSHTDCAGTLCIETLTGGICSQPCASDGDCPAPARCMAETCVPPGPRPLGGDCASHFDCVTQTCVADDEGDVFCTVPCDPHNACPEGAVCLDYGPLDYCRAAGRQPEGGSCHVDAGCQAGLRCQPGDAAASWSFCARDCPPQEVSPDCGEDQVCGWAPLPLEDGLPTGRCVADDGAGSGGPCGPTAGRCRANLVCVLHDPLEGLCQPDCLLGDDSVCVTGRSCRSLGRDETPGRGVCADADSDELVVWLPGDALPELLETGPAPEEIRVVPIEDAPPPPSTGGCRAGARPGGGALLSLLLMLGLVCLRRTVTARRTAP